MLCSVDVTLCYRKASVKDGGVPNIPLLLESIYWFSSFFFPFQYTHLSFGLSSAIPLGEHSKISAQRASCRDSVNRRHQPENLTTIFYAISSTRYNKVFHSDYTTTHNAHIGQLIQF